MKNAGRLTMGAMFVQSGGGSLANYEMAAMNAPKIPPLPHNTALLATNCAVSAIFVSYPICAMSNILLRFSNAALAPS